MYDGWIPSSFCHRSRTILVKITKLDIQFDAGIGGWGKTGSYLFILANFIRSFLVFSTTLNDTLKANSYPQELKCHSRPNWELFGYLIKMTWIQISKVRTYHLGTFHSFYSFSKTNSIYFHFGMYFDRRFYLKNILKWQFSLLYIIFCDSLERTLLPQR